MMGSLDWMGTAGFYANCQAQGSDLPFPWW
jgi:hypothetical protein